MPLTRPVCFLSACTLVSQKKKTERLEAQARDRYNERGRARNDTDRDTDRDRRPRFDENSGGSSGSRK